VPHPDDRSATVTVRPPLAAGELELVAGFAGVGAGPRSLWPGQPGPRSPWVPCADGCCLVAEGGHGTDPVRWLRFLVREVLSPQARDARERAARFGVPGGHQVEGRVVLKGPLEDHVLVAAGRQVRVTQMGGVRAPSGRPRPSGPRSPPS
jgi:hypothetical protein